MNIDLSKVIEYLGECIKNLNEINYDGHVSKRKIRNQYFSDHTE